MFDILNSRDFYGKLLDEFEAYQNDPMSSRLAMNVVITAYHLHEWVWGDWLQTDYEAWRAIGIRDKASFTKWLEDHWIYFQEMQSLANGSKHFNRQAAQSTKRSGSFMRGAFQQDAFDVEDLKIETTVAGKQVWLSAEVIFNESVLFWRDFLSSYSPYDSLPTNGAVLTEFK